MDYAHITDGYAVAPQIDPAEVEAIRAAGFTDVICNRPDEEVSPDLVAEQMRAAVEGAGLRFHLNPVRNGALTEDNVRLQAEAIAGAAGPVLAYCRSGTRSSVVWALGRTDMAADEILAATARAGYALDGLRPQLEARQDQPG